MRSKKRKANAATKGKIRRVATYAVTINGIRRKGYVVEVEGPDGRPQSIGIPLNTSKRSVKQHRAKKKQRAKAR